MELTPLALLMIWLVFRIGITVLSIVAFFATKETASGPSSALSQCLLPHSEQLRNTLLLGVFFFSE
ncbi:hypothetical protein TIFTF001_012870 [Ficus carica]|uniref:Uncharacterized protein n=1 Tax=Ficus carica TaxID=3494 RepID=A0AA88AGQ9_FICCA|nr:hypothetical protein TIFTF001_012870 [Ficus carica]